MMGWLMMFGATVVVLVFVALLIFGIYGLARYLRGPQ